MDLWHALGDVSQRVLLAGGYGLYLQQLDAQAANLRTLLPASRWPAPRATEDLDLLLSTELVGDAIAMRAVRACLDQLGYAVVEGCEHLQFVRGAALAQSVKVDLLTAQRSTLERYPSIHADARRARPVAGDRPPLHAHPTDGALALDDTVRVVEVVGRRSNGESASARVRLPQPFTYLLMKLTAYRDRRNDVDKDLARHHALDVFRILAMLTEPDLDAVREQASRFAEDPQVRSCVDLIRSDFASKTSRGLLAMREHPLWVDDQDIPTVIEALHTLGG